MNHRDDANDALSDAQMALVADCLPKQRGNVRLSNRAVLEAIIHVRRTRCAWRDLPTRFGPWHTVYTRSRRWTRAGVLDLVYAKLAESPTAPSIIGLAVPDATTAARSGTLALTDLASLADRLRPLIFELASNLKRERRRYRISQFEVATLMAIEKSPGIGMAPLARRVEAPAATMGVTVRRLAAHGWIERAIGASMDERLSGVVITATGRKVLAEVRAGRSSQLVRQFVALGPDATAALAAALEPLTRLSAGLDAALPRSKS